MTTAGKSKAATRIRYTRPEAADQLSISVRQLDYLRAKGQIIGRRDGNQIYIDHDELVSYAKSRNPEDV